MSVLPDARRAAPEAAAPVIAGAARWYAVQTLAHRESGAQAQLLRQNFVPFLPQVEKTVRHARKLRTVRAPLFPGYLFVQLDLARDRWRSVNGTFGVSRLVTANDRPAPVPVGVIEALRAMLDGAGLMKLDDGLRVGQTVQVMVGPFADMLGQLDRLDGAGRVRVLLQLMGGAVPVLVDRTALRVA
ncbi:MAG: hypothetical protein JWM36_1674 [Hyphomicrobiales bacterium]|nr:hypothetical protein [Hyphomicrobiales bacterium]